MAQMIHLQNLRPAGFRDPLVGHAHFLLDEVLGLLILE